MKYASISSLQTRLLACLLAAAALSPPTALASPQVPHVLLITHPRARVLRDYVMLVRKQVLRIDNLRLVGVYHESETEDYQDAADYIAREHLNWIKLEVVKCKLGPEDLFVPNACRASFDKLIARSGGIVFNGGPDIPPSLYGQSQLLSTVVETLPRHYFEIALSVALMGSSRAPLVHPILAHRPNYPVLGICVGMQTLNVAAGGSLIQDIPTQLYGERSVEDALRAGPATWHRNHSQQLAPEEGVSLGVMHPVHLAPEAPLFLRSAAPSGQALPQVLSIHHQAIDAVGSGFVVWATSGDGKIIEVIGRRDFPNVLGIQFHPERSALWDQTEQQLMCPKNPTYNFAYGLLERCPSSRRFNEAVWAWLARSVTRQQATDATGHS